MRMLLSFQRPPCLFGEDIPGEDCLAQRPKTPPGRTKDYSASGRGCPTAPLWRPRLGRRPRLDRKAKPDSSPGSRPESSRRRLTSRGRHRACPLPLGDRPTGRAASTRRGPRPADGWSERPSPRVAGSPYTHAREACWQRPMPTNRRRPACVHLTGRQVFAATTEANTPGSSCRSPLARTTHRVFAGGAFACPERPDTAVRPSAHPIPAKRGRTAFPSTRQLHTHNHREHGRA